MKIVGIAGSPSGSSRSTALLGHIGRQLAEDGHAWSVIPVRHLPAGDLIAGRSDGEAIQAALAEIAAADGLVVATPVYKAAYSGLLKTFLDLLPQKAFAGKAILPVASGGSLAHALAIDYALRPVLSALSARVAVAGVFAEDAQLRILDGELHLEAALAERLDEARQRFAEALAWGRPSGAGPVVAEAAPPDSLPRFAPLPLYALAT